MDEKKHSQLGKLSIILAIISLIGIFIGVIVLFFLPSPAISHREITVIYDMIIFSFFIFLITSIIAMISGLIAFLGKRRDRLGKYAIIIGLTSIGFDFLLFLMTLFKGMP